MNTEDDMGFWLIAPDFIASLWEDDATAVRLLTYLLAHWDEVLPERLRAALGAIARPPEIISVQYLGGPYPAIGLSSAMAARDRLKGHLADTATRLCLEADDEINRYVESAGLDRLIELSASESQCDDLTAR